MKGVRYNAEVLLSAFDQMPSYNYSIRLRSCDVGTAQVLGWIGIVGLEDEHESRRKGVINEMM